MEKLIVDGKVAVLVSSGFGAGWSTWMNNEDVVFDPVIAQMCLDGASDEDIIAVAEQRYPEEYFGGVSGLYVMWVPVGARFRIEEYDGAETLHLEEDYSWYTA